MQIGEAIRKAREAKGLSQKQVAISSKMDQAHYSRIENGKTDPSFSIILRITKNIGVDLHDLFRADEVFKDINSVDKSLMEKISLIEELDKDEQKAIYILLDGLISKKRMKDNLTQMLNA